MSAAPEPQPQDAAPEEDPASDDPVPPPLPVDGAIPVPAESGVPAIEIHELHKSFGPMEVLRGIDLTVRLGEVVCIIGASGSGKSTLLRCVNRLEEPTSGRILIEGDDITAPTATWTRCGAASAWCSSSSTSSPISP